MIFKRKTKEKVVHIIVYYVLFCVFYEITSLLLQNNPALRTFTPILFASYTIIEFFFFCWFYYLLFPAGEIIKKIVPYIFISFTLFAIIDFYIINQHLSFDSLVSGIEALIVIVLCGYYLFYQVSNTRDMMVYGTFNFWVIVAFLLFISGTFFLYIMTANMGKDPMFRYYYFIINLSFNILKNSFLCIAMVMKSTPAIRREPSIPDIDLGDELVFQNNT